MIDSILFLGALFAVIMVEKLQTAGVGVGNTLMMMTLLCMTASRFCPLLYFASIGLLEEMRKVTSKSKLGHLDTHCISSWAELLLSPVDHQHLTRMLHL